jgi:HNH endonuclease
MGTTLFSMSRSSAERSRDWRQRNKEKVAEYLRNWRKDNWHHIRLYRRSRRTKGMAECVKYRESHKEEQKQKRDGRTKEIAEYCSRWYRDNRERILERIKEWRKTHAEEYAARARSRRSVEGRHTAADIQSIWDRQRHKCAVTDCVYPISDKRGPDKYHVDHIQPIALGGTGWPANLQILCGKHNRQKLAKDEIEWANSQGFLFIK